MKTLIVNTAIKFLIPLFVLYSLYLLFRGHNEPGGGFIGGLIGALPFVMYAMVYGVDEARKTFPFNWPLFKSLGLSLAISAALLGLIFKGDLFAALWADFYLPIIGKPGTPILFDIGVYFVVVGVIVELSYNMINYED
ncbi:MAG: Na(+)/H(+) antiporter subunit B [Cyclobacteriaceae bacterium]|nr:Na(+)/H(+) antiporter subunit B [Cyclobacteriaceae bacterium]MCH8516417.1 Na(+)/H(+) antiporter subunit B [Cyclobacteriaceae bacterium]